MTKRVTWKVWINDTVCHNWDRKKDALEDVQKHLLEGCDVTLTRDELINSEYKSTPIDIQYLREQVYTILEKHYNTPVQPLPQAVWDEVQKALSLG